MPQPLPPQTDEIIRDLQASLRDCQQRLALLEGRRRLDLPRGLTENIPAPGEGEVLIQASTNKPWYYADGEWRPFGGDGSGGQWCRIYSSADQTIPADNSVVVTFGEIVNNYTGYFGTDDADGFGAAGDSITILQSGVYAVTYRLVCDGPLPDVPFSTQLNGIDWNSNLYYERTWEPDALTGYSLHDSYVFRSDEEYGSAPPQLYVIADIPAASSNSLVIQHGTLAPVNRAGNATYLEVVRLSDAPITGNPS